MKNCKKTLTIIAMFLQCYVLVAQEFNWICDGYVEHSGGGFYENIDNSGVNLTISGLVNDFVYISYGCTFFISSGHKIDSLGTTYLYTYQFSEPVDVDFEMINLDAGTTSDGVPYSGEVTFSGNPTFYDYSSNLTINGSTVIPSGGGSSINIRYTNINSFEIIHGDGVTKPRRLQFKNIGFVPTIVSVEEPTNFWAVYPNPAKEKIFLELNNIYNCDIKLINSIGQEMDIQKHRLGNIIELNTQNLHSGIYMLAIYQDEELLSVEKVIIQ